MLLIYNNTMPFSLLSYLSLTLPEFFTSPFVGYKIKLLKRISHVGIVLLPCIFLLKFQLNYYHYVKR